MKKYTSGSFTATKYAIYKEDNDTNTTFPAEIIADGENASAKVYGNMQQTGTPTPTTPITPSECGDLETTGEHTGQYKIPIESANTTTNIFLGEVQTTRSIYKHELTGQETWLRTSVGKMYSSDALNGIPNYKHTLAITTMCSHFKSIANASNTGVLNVNEMCLFGNPDAVSTREIYIYPENYATAADFATYLQQQYAAGTPVTVWYILSQSTTGTVNEPLRKIGNDADIVTTTIPTVAAADNINVTTTLKPSALDLTYTGWHKYDDKKRSGGSWGTVTSNAKKKKSLLGSRKTTKGKT